MASIDWRRSEAAAKAEWRRNHVEYGAMHAGQCCGRRSWFEPIGLYIDAFSIDGLNRRVAGLTRDGLAFAIDKFER